MPVPAQAQFETLFGTTFAAAPKRPFFGRGDIVWVKAEFEGADGSWNKANRYEVVEWYMITFDDAGTEKFADSTLTTQVANTGTQPTSTTTGWFYRLQNVDSGTVTSGWHESELLGESAMETYVQGQVPTFIAP